MSKIWSMMDIGKRAMANSQTGLQTVSHNIANKSTEGYSRQRVNFQSNVPIGMGKLRIGSGSKASAVERINNEYLGKQIQKESKQLGYDKSRSEAMNRVEQVYNEQINKGLNKHMAEFFNAFRELSNNPESLASRTLVKESGDFLARDFQRVNGQLGEIKNDIDYQITTLVSEVNSITEEIADLNEKIQKVTISGGLPNDERDRRELLLKQLSEKMNIKWAESSDGAVTVTAGNSAILVSGYSTRELFTAPITGQGSKREGHLDIYYKATKEGTPVNVTKQIKSGAIGGLLETRDETIIGLQNKLDKLAFGLQEQVNRVHQQGYNRYNRTGVAFFKPLATQEDAAEKMKISDLIANDVGLVASGASPNSPGDNRIANLISNLQNQQTMENGSATFDDFYSTTVGEVGIMANKANKAYESQDDILKQLNNIRESISGVSLDEETTKMIEYQKSFDASARLIKTADEMLDTVLNLKR